MSASWSSWICASACRSRLDGRWPGVGLVDWPDACAAGGDDMPDAPGPGIGGRGTDGGGDGSDVTDEDLRSGPVPAPELLLVDAFSWYRD